MMSRHLWSFIFGVIVLTIMVKLFVDAFKPMMPYLVGAIIIIALLAIGGFLGRWYYLKRRIW